jgi:hypothetical protein
MGRISLMLFAFRKPEAAESVGRRYKYHRTVGASFWHWAAPFSEFRAPTGQFGALMSASRIFLFPSIFLQIILAILRMFLRLSQTFVLTIQLV